MCDGSLPYVRFAFYPCLRSMIVWFVRFQKEMDECFRVQLKVRVDFRPPIDKLCLLVFGCPPTLTLIVEILWLRSQIKTRLAEVPEVRGGVAQSLLSLLIAPNALNKGTIFLFLYLRIFYL